MEKKYRIETTRLSLVPMEMKYLYSTHEYAADRENTIYMLNLPNETLEETMGFIKYAEEEWGKSDPEFFEYAILMGDAHVGAISLYPEKEDPGSAEFGWTVNKKYWRQGICTEAAKALMKYAAKTYGIRRFFAHCDSENVSSRTVMEKIGMKKMDEYGGRYNKQSTEERRECLYELKLELFDIVDEKGNPTGETVERSDAHTLGTRHRTAHIWIARNVMGKWQVLLQKRAMTKDSFPGRYDTSSAGHIQAGDEPLESAIRELEEELGITAAPEELKFAGTFHIQYEKEFHNKIFRDNEIAFVYMYVGKIDVQKIQVQKEELECVEWFDLEETYNQCLIHNQKFCVPVKGLEIAREYLNTYSVENVPE